MVALDPVPVVRLGNINPGSNINILHRLLTDFPCLTIHHSKHEFISFLEDRDDRPCFVMAMGVFVAEEVDGVVGAELHIGPTLLDPTHRFQNSVLSDLLLLLSCDPFGLRGLCCC
jgi:hypothetical protein